MRSSAIVVAVAVTIATASAAITGGRAPSPPPSRPHLHASLQLRTEKTTVPRNMASFSMEVMSPREMILIDPEDPTSLRESYIGLMRFLGEVSSPAGGGGSGGRNGPNLRIGGNSADNTWYIPNASSGAAPFPHGYVVGDRDIAAFAHVAGWNGTLSVDISLRNATDPANAIAYAAAVHRQLDRADVLNYEIGNEPELFPSVKNGYRPSPYTFEEWEGQWLLYAKQLTAQVTGPSMIQGAVFCCGQWDHKIPQYVANYSAPSATPFLQTISHHFYPMAGKDATIEKLLAPEAVDLFSYNHIAGDCNRHGVPFVMGEGNSAYDGGREGVSNVFASALWAVDLLFEAVANGIRRFNFHGGPHGAYTPIDTETNPPYAFARPLYYAMWAFTDATSSDASLLNVEYNKTNPEGIKLWATHHNDAVTIVAIHKKPWDMGGVDTDVAVNVSSIGIGHLAGANVTVRVLTAAAVNSTDGLTFGGLTLDNSTTGTPHGTPKSEHHTVGADGVLWLFVQPLHVVVADIFVVSA